MAWTHSQRRGRHGFAFPDLIADLYRPITRNGAGIVEVGARLQKALAALQSIEPDAGLDCGTVAADALGRAIAAYDSAVDAERLLKMHRRYCLHTRTLRLDDLIARRSRNPTRGFYE